MTGSITLATITHSTEKQKANAAIVKEKTKQYLEPATSDAIAGHIALMLKHYYQDAKLPEPVHEGLAMQWLECLENFPEWAVKHAVIGYLKADDLGRKPKPGQIVKLAANAVAKYNALIRQCDKVLLAPPPPPKREPPTEEEKAAVSRIVEQVKRNIAMGPEIKYGPPRRTLKKNPTQEEVSEALTNEASK